MEKGITGKIESYSRKINDVVATAAGFTVFIMIGVVVGNVILIATRVASIDITEELIEMLMILVAFGGFAYADILNKHITATIVVDRFSPKLRAITDTFSYSVCLFICLVFSWQLLLYAHKMTAIRRECFGSGFPFYPFTWFAVIGFFLLDMQYLMRIIASISKILKEAK